MLSPGAGLGSEGSLGMPPSPASPSPTAPQKPQCSLSPADSSSPRSPLFLACLQRSAHACLALAQSRSAARGGNVNTGTPGYLQNLSTSCSGSMKTAVPASPPGEFSSWFYPNAGSLVFLLLQKPFFLSFSFLPAQKRAQHVQK